MATVNSKGKVTATGKGSTTITVKLKDASGTVLATKKCKVTVNAVLSETAPSPTITLNPAELSLKIGKSKTIKAEVINEPKGAQITWKSDNKKVATVNSEGKVTAKGKGTAKITAILSYTQNGKTKTIKSDCTVTIGKGTPKISKTSRLKAFYGQELKVLKLPAENKYGSWSWQNSDNKVGEVGINRHLAKFVPYDIKNYDWSKIPGYNNEDNVIYSYIDVEVSVDKSVWGKVIKRSGITHYVDDYGKTSIEITDLKSIFWVKEESDETSAWYGIDNSKGIFKLGSRFYVQWLNLKEHKDDYLDLWDEIDEDERKRIEGTNGWIFRMGVIGPDGKKYVKLPHKTKVYVQIGDDWDKDQLQAVRIKNKEDLDIQTAYQDNLTYPEGKDIFGVMLVSGFSPYLIYDEETEAEKSTYTNIEDENDTKNIVDNNTQSYSEFQNSIDDHFEKCISGQESANISDSNNKLYNSSNKSPAFKNDNKLYNSSNKSPEFENDNKSYNSSNKFPEFENDNKSYNSSNKFPKIANYNKNTKNIENYGDSLNIINNDSSINFQNIPAITHMASLATGENYSAILITFVTNFISVAAIWFIHHKRKNICQ